MTVEVLRQPHRLVLWPRRWRLGQCSVHVDVFLIKEHHPDQFPARSTAMVRLRRHLEQQRYIGRLARNRLRYIKDPDTGRRVSRLNARSSLRKTCPNCGSFRRWFGAQRNNGRKNRGRRRSKRRGGTWLTLRDGVLAINVKGNVAMLAAASDSEGLAAPVGFGCGGGI